MPWTGEYPREKYMSTLKICNFHIEIWSQLWIVHNPALYCIYVFCNRIHGTEYSLEIRNFGLIDFTVLSYVD